MSTTIKGRISTKQTNMIFTGTSVEFSSGTVSKMNDIWFVYFQRVSKRLKTCDAIFCDGQHLIEFTTEQKNIEELTDAAKCPVYFGGLDPMPWKKLMREASTHKWQREDWQHVLEEPEEESEDSDEDWTLPSDSEDSEDSEEEDNFSDDAPPSKKLCRRLEEQTSRDSESE